MLPAAASLGIVSIPGLIKAGNQDHIVSADKKEGMPFCMLDRTGIMVSELSLGTFPFYTEENYPVLDESIERGQQEKL